MAEPTAGIAIDVDVGGPVQDVDMNVTPKPSDLSSMYPARIAYRENVAESMRQHTPSHRRPTGPMTTIATDGAFHPAFGGGSFAWVSADGRFGTGKARCSSSFHAELIAIDEAIRAQPQFTRIRLLVDSQQAVDAVNAALADPPERRERREAIERRLYSIANAAANRDVVLQWVRGHSGHPLNDAADRIAVLMRRSCAWGTSPDVTTKLVRSIADAGVAASVA